MMRSILKSAIRTLLKSMSIILSSVTYSHFAHADAGCPSFTSSGACMLWSSVLILGGSSIFWAICIPVLFIYNFFIKLKTKYIIYYLCISFISAISLVFIAQSFAYQYFRYFTFLEDYHDQEWWVISPLVYSIIYFALYLIQVISDRKRGRKKLS
jgi:hypothetical protein